MKKILTLLALTMCLFAQPSLAAESVVDAKAALKQHIKQLTTFEASFSQRVIDIDGKELMQGKGKVRLAHPSLIRWHALEPDENLMVSDGETLWVYNIDLEQATAMPAKQAIDSTPFALLASFDDVLWQNYQVSKKGEAYIITPVKQDSQVKQLSVYFANQKFSQLVIEDLSQQKSEFTFSDTHSNQPLTETQRKTFFSFTLPQGVELDDQR